MLNNKMKIFIAANVTFITLQSMDPVAQLHHQQGINQKSFQEIESTLNNSAAMGTPEMAILTQNLSAMGPTPGKSLGRAAKRVLDGATEGVTDEEDSPADNNNRLAAFYGSNVKQAVLAAQAADHLSSAEKNHRTAVDTDHIEKPTTVLNGVGDVVKVGGGHGADEYVSQNLFGTTEDVFIGQDNETMAILVKGKHSKTMRPSFKKDEIVATFKEGVSLAINPKERRFKIIQRPDATFFAKYVKKDNSLVSPTLFPILMINGMRCDQHGRIYAGKFTKIDEDCNVQSAKTDVFVPVGIFTQMMTLGNKYDTTNPNLKVSDITAQMKQYCHQELQQRNMNNFPAKIYGLLDFRKS